MDRFWMQQAACAGAPAEIMFPQNHGDAVKGKKICAGCPVNLVCRDYALEQLDKGIWISGLWGGQHAGELKRFPRNAGELTDRICEWAHCEQFIPARKANKGGNLQRYCSESCRRKAGKSRAGQRAA